MKSPSSILNWLRGVATRERNILRYEGRALRHIFLPTKHNSWTKSVGTVLLVAIWGTVYIASAFGYVSAQPPFYTEFTLLVFLVLGRWWGVELVYESMVTIEGGDQKLPNGKKRAKR